MKKLPAIILLLLITVSTLMQSCGESDCPLTTNSFAHFDFLDAETHQAVKFSPAFDVTGFITTDVIVRDTLEDGTIKETVVKDSLMNDTIFNKAESSMSLPLSYTSKTTYVLHYTEKMRDTASIFANKVFFGYVVVGILAFLLGISVTLMCDILHKRNKERDEENDRTDR